MTGAAADGPTAMQILFDYKNVMNLSGVCRPTALILTLSVRSTSG